MSWKGDVENMFEDRVLCKYAPNRVPTGFKHRQTGWSRITSLVLKKVALQATTKDSSQNYIVSVKEQDIEFLSCACDSHSSNTSDDESVASESSDLSDITNTDNNLISGQPKDPEDRPRISIRRICRIYAHNNPVSCARFTCKYIHKEPIFEYNGLKYVLEFRTVLDGIHQILTKSITEEFILNYKLSLDNVFGQRQLYDSDCKASRYPVFMTLGNILLARRNKADAKILLGYIPKLEYNSASEKQSSKFRSAKAQTFSLHTRSDASAIKIFKQFWRSFICQ
ncbi:hypothetical protein C2G38_2221725 [Gigaspora rosea]|uniref:Uncharacterized protein n=1 Tax=Gigaspora rosea TaxID=44941 RepID=A0A397U371_9GLOM|nr:hypothetical protein C2G38_2221725 [Gigaspora rosea]